MRILVCESSDFSEAVIPAVHELTDPPVESMRVLAPREVEPDPPGAPHDGEELVEAMASNPTDPMRAERELAGSLR